MFIISLPKFILKIINFITKKNYSSLEYQIKLEIRRHTTTSYGNIYKEYFKKNEIIKITEIENNLVKNMIYYFNYFFPKYNLQNKDYRIGFKDHDDTKDFIFYTIDKEKSIKKSNVTH